MMDGVRVLGGAGTGEHSRKVTFNVFQLLDLYVILVLFTVLKFVVCGNVNIVD